MNDEVSTEFDNELFDIRRSVRYHMRRCRFYDSFHDVTTALSVMLGVGAISTLLSGSLSSNHVAVIIGVVSAFGVLDLVIGTTQKARLHNSLAGKFVDMEKRMLKDGDTCLKEIQLARLETEKEEPPVLDVLNVICHNELMTAMGYDRSQLAKIGWFQRMSANFFDFRSDTI